MLDSAREFVASHHDVAKVVRDAQRFSVNVPLVGKVAVPPPDQLAFYGVLAVLGVTELIPWPVALGLGAGHALATRYATEAAAEAATEAAEETVTETKAPAKKTSPRKAPAKKTPARKATATKATAKKATRRS